MHRSERRAQQQARTAEERQGIQMYRLQTLAVRQDVEHTYNQGQPVHDCHMGLWTVHRLLEKDALPAQLELARKLAEDGVTEASLAIWLGTDKLCLGDLHYPLGEAHGVHTLMKGLATRLESIAHRSNARDFIIFEGDAVVPDCLGGHLLEVLTKVRNKEANFCWLGFFTDAKINHEGRKERVELTAAEAQSRGIVRKDGSGIAGKHDIFVNWPFKFLPRCRGDTIPNNGCQMFYLKKDFIPEFCYRLLAYNRPVGLDMLFFDKNLLSDEECHFLSYSICGQRPGNSDSWEAVNVSAGEIKDFDIKLLQVRNFAESPKTSYKRAKKWKWHVGMEQKGSMQTEWLNKPSFKHWLHPLVKSAWPFADDEMLSADDFAARRACSVVNKAADAASSSRDPHGSVGPAEAPCRRDMRVRCPPPKVRTSPKGPLLPEPTYHRELTRCRTANLSAWGVEALSSRSVPMAKGPPSRRLAVKAAAKTPPGLTPPPPLAAPPVKAGPWVMSVTP